jgi:hypothetical protein
MKKRTALIFVFLLVNSIFAGEKKVIFFPQGFIKYSYVSPGFSNVISSQASSLLYDNPASAGHFSKITCGLNFGSSSRINNFGNGYKAFDHNNDYFLNHLCFILPVDKWRFVIGYYKKYGAKLEYETIYEHPFVDINSFTPFEEYKLESFSTLVSYNRHIFGRNHFFSFGLQGDFNRFSYLEEKLIANIRTLSESSNSYNYKIGIVYHFDSTLYVGALYEHVIKNKLLLGKKSNSFLSDYYVLGNVPASVSIGISYLMLKNLFISSIIKISYWNKIDSRIKESKDFSFDTQFQINDKLKTSLGLLSLNFKIHDKEITQEQQGATYITTGMLYKFKSTQVYFIFSSNILFQSNNRKENKINIGIDIEIENS